MADTKAKQIYEQLEEDLIFGRFDYRTFLNVGEIATSYGVSKAPVRDALQILCSKGFLISYPGRGYMVNYFTDEEVNQIQALRRHLEKFSVQTAVEHASDEEIKGLEIYLDGPSKSNSKFNINLAAIGKNRQLEDMVRELVFKVAYSQNERLLALQEEDYDIHREIINAMLARDLEKAQQEIEKDIIAV